MLLPVRMVRYLYRPLRNRMQPSRGQLRLCKFFCLVFGCLLFVGPRFWHRQARLHLFLSSTNPFHYFDHGSIFVGHTLSLYR
jgi:hypothetical protein